MFRKQPEQKEQTLVIKLYSSADPDDPPTALVGEVVVDFFPTYVETTKLSGPPGVIELALSALTKVVHTPRHAGRKRGWNAVPAGGGGGGGGILSAIFSGAFMGLLLGHTSEIAGATDDGGAATMANRMDRHGIVDEGNGHLHAHDHDCDSNF